MGAGNVSVVYARWTGLPDGPFRILGQMALIALDGDEVPRYWGGRDLLAHALGYVDLPKRPTGAELDRDAAAQAVRERDRAFRAVARAVEQLTAAGVVERVSGGVKGHNAVYALQLLAEHKTIKTATRKLGAGQRDAVKQQNRAAVKGDNACHPDDGERTTPGVTQEDTDCHPPRRTTGVLLRVTPDVAPGGHPVSPEKDTRCHPEEEEEERGKEEEQSAPEVISHLADAGATSGVGEMATSAGTQSDDRCPHDVRHGLTRNPAGRIRCPACRRSTAVPA